jgi:hypothetical protein
LGHPVGSLPTGGELLSTLPSEHPLELQIIHLEVSTVYEQLLIALERLAIPCIFNSRLSSSFINKVDIFTPELVLRVFIVNLDTEGTHGDYRGEDDLNFVHQEERRFSGGPTR